MDNVINNIFIEKKNNKLVGVCLVLLFVNSANACSIILRNNKRIDILEQQIEELMGEKGA